MPCIAAKKTPQNLSITDSQLSIYTFSVICSSMWVSPINYRSFIHVVFTAEENGKPCSSNLCYSRVNSTNRSDMVSLFICLRGARSFYGQGQNNGKIWKYKWVPQYQIQMLQSRVYAFLLLFLDSSLLKKLSGLQLSVPTAKAMDASCEFSLSPPPSEQEMCMLYVD